MNGPCTNVPDLIDSPASLSLFYLSLFLCSSPFYYIRLHSLFLIIYQPILILTTPPITLATSTHPPYMKYSVSSFSPLTPHSPWVFLTASLPSMDVPSSSSSFTPSSSSSSLAHFIYPSSFNSSLPPYSLIPLTFLQLIPGPAAPLEEPLPRPTMIKRSGLGTLHKRFPL